MLTTKFSRLYRLLFVCLLATTLAVSAFAQGSSSIVISQVYGAGGNTGATYKNDFIELFNRSSSPVSVNGWSVQYASATGTSWQVTNLTGTIQPGGYFLVQEAGGTVGASLPTPDATGGISMAAGAGKVALVNSTTALSGTPCPTGAFVDLVAYGSGATCAEGGTSTAAPSATLSVIRAGYGCTDTDKNNTDFSAVAPSPRNSSSPTNLCAGPTNPSGAGLASPWSADQGETVLLTVNVSPGSNPTSTGLAVSGALSNINVADQPFYDDGTHGDAVAGDKIFSLQVTIPADLPTGAKTVTATISDSQGRNVPVTIPVTVTLPAAFYNIHDIRASLGTPGTLLGTDVRTSGIVTGRRSGGFYLQEKNGVYNGTSLAVYVYTGGTAPAEAAIGNEVTVRGTVQLYPASATPAELELASPVIKNVLSTGNPLPTPIDISPDPAQQQFAQFEKYAGMLAKISKTKVVGPSNGTVFYVTEATTPRPFREPGIQVGATIPTNTGINVPIYDGNPEVIAVDMSGCTNPAALASGDATGDLVGPLGYSSGYTLYTCLTGTTGKMAAAVADRGQYEFTIASYNMYNFTGGTTQTAKAALEVMNVLKMPDIIGVEEVSSATALQNLATKINTDAGVLGQTPNYQVLMGAISGSQNVGFLYRGDRVNVVSSSVLADPAIKMGGTCTSYSLWDRPPFQIDATVTVPGRPVVPVTVIVNHLRSLIDVDKDDTTGYCARLKRDLEAEALAQILSGMQQQGKNLVTLGDFNAFDFNDGYIDVMGTLIGNPAPADQVALPTTDWIDPNLTDLITSWPDKVIYTYVENGSAQSIDHIVVNDAMLTLSPHVDVAHVNADFPTSFSSISTRPERNSDHDQPIAYFTAPLPLLTVTPDSVSKTYGAANPVPTGTINGLQPGDETITATYSFGSVDATTGVGTYPITATLNDPDGKLTNYRVKLDAGTLTITAAPLTVTIDNKAKTYGAANPELTGTVFGLRNNDNITASYSTPATAASPIGDFPITATLDDPDGKLVNYSVTNTPGKLTVSGALLTVDVANASRTYGANNPTFTGTINGIQNSDNITATYDTTATKATGVGDHQITATLVDPDNKLVNYIVTNNPGTLTISAAPLTVTADDKSMTYGGTLPTFTASFGGFVNNEDATVLTGTPSLTTAATSTSNAGAHTITAAQGTLAAANYTFTFVNGTLTIDKAGLTVSANDKAKTYGSVNPTFDGTLTGVVAGDDITATYSTTATAATGIGTYPITATLVDPGNKLANYTVTNTPGTLTIDKAAISVVANDKTRAYGATNPTFDGTLTGVVAGDGITASYATTATAASAIGTYPITATLSDPNSKLANYTVVNTPGTLSVTKAALSVVANNKTRTYGAANPTLDGTITGMVSGDGISATFATTATAASAVGNYTISSTVLDPNDKLANYNVTVTDGTLTVDPAALTITTNNKTRAFGAANPTFDGSITGLVNGDVITATYATAAVQTSNAGTYPITATLADAGNKLGNYTVTNNGGTLTITPATTTTAITSSKNIVNLPGSLTLTATVTSTGGTPTGTVTFYLGATSLGTAALDGTGKASLTVSTSLTAVGRSTVSASFAGSTNYATSTSSNLTQYIYAAAPDYSLTATPNTLTLRQGQSGSVQVTMTPINGFNGNITIACSGLPQTMGCTFTPSQLTGNLDNTPVTGTLTISTMAPARTVAQAPQSKAPMGMIVFSMSGLGVMGLVFAGDRSKRSKRVLFAIVCALVLMMLLSSCGSPNPFASPGATAPGNVTTTVVATATAGTNGAAPASHQVVVQITITQ